MGELLGESSSLRLLFCFVMKNYEELFDKIVYISVVIKIINSYIENMTRGVYNKNMNGGEKHERKYSKQ